MKMTGRCWMTALGLMLMTAACAAEDAAQSDKPTEEIALIKRERSPITEFTPTQLEDTVDHLIGAINQSGLKPIQVVVLLKHLSTFFEPIATGANRAMGELEAVGNVLGPSTQMTTDDGAASQNLQNQQVANAIEDGAQGIGISPYDFLNEASINEAAAQGLHVVTFDTDLKDSGRTLYVGAIQKSAGARAAQALLDSRIGELPPPPGTVVVHGDTSTQWYDGSQRTFGVLEALGAAGYTTQVVQAVFINGQEGFDVDQMKTQILNADPPVVGMIGVFNISYRCVMAAEAANRPDIPIVAFDFDSKTVEYMQKKRIKATVVQRQYYEGYLVPYILYGIQHIGLDATKEILRPLMTDENQMPDEHRVNLGVDVVPANKVQDYNDFLDQIGSIQ
ncbi:sugar ABC transporter substrate-binding protein [Sorangium atrum]|uniref:Substrate-binding domain-containing protein n=1 Tax=Sorangium atrum TaxID=2995308 RepID=A0ABT5C7F2_9BACT|nr:substrate-binding domain-containing protein [Sorangium aterium]MDC0681578.1 substrate-binding domain-containing protein [Sorangium aterium]